MSFIIDHILYMLFFIIFIANSVSVSKTDIRFIQFLSSLIILICDVMLFKEVIDALMNEEMSEGAKANKEKAKVEISGNTELVDGENTINIWYQDYCVRNIDYIKIDNDKQIVGEHRQSGSTIQV